jgi:pyruvate dehydrogenase E1 component beta subunit
MANVKFGAARIAAVADLMREDDNIVVVGGASFGGLHHQEYTRPLFEEFDSRILRTPIAELGFCGLAVGAAIAGLKPIVTIGTGSFAFEAWPQIVNEAPNIQYMSGGKVKCPVTFHTLGGIRLGGAAQHSARPQAMLMQAAGLQVIAPALSGDVKALLKGVMDNERPTFWIDHSLLTEEEGDEALPDIPFGKARVVREGSDVTIVGYSIDLIRCLHAADILATQGISAEVIDLRTLAPLDHETVLKSVAKTGLLVVSDECSPVCSVASEISAFVAEEGFGLLRKPMQRINFANVPVPMSAVLEEYLMPTVDKVVAAAKVLMT